MVAPTDPHGINTAGSPKKLDHAIDSWGYVHGRQERTRLIIGGGVFFVGALTIIVAFFLYLFGTDNYHKISQEWHRSSQLEGEAFRRYINENEILGRSADPERTYIEEVMPAKLALDLQYVKQQSLALDLRIVLRTIRRLL